MQVPGARGPKTEEKCYHAIRDGFPHLFQERLLFLVGLPQAGNSDLLVFWPILGLWEIPDPGEKHNNAIFRCQGHFWEKTPAAQKVSPQSSSIFFICDVLADRTATSGKSRNTGCLVHYGLGQPLALGKIPRCIICTTFLSLCPAACGFSIAGTILHDVLNVLLNGPIKCRGR